MLCATPDTHLGREASRIGQTARDIGNSAQSIQDAWRQFGHLFAAVKSDSEQWAILAGSQGRRYLADNQDPAIVQVFLSQPVNKRTEIQLDSSSGNLVPTSVTIEPGKDSGQTRLTSDKTGPVEVRFVKATPKLKAAPTNT